MRELDAVLQAFLDQGYGDLPDDDKRRFAALLDLPDPDLYGYVLLCNDPQDQDVARLVARIRDSVRFTA